MARKIIRKFLAYPIVLLMMCSLSDLFRYVGCIIYVHFQWSRKIHYFLVLDNSGLNQNGLLKHLHLLAIVKSQKVMVIQMKGLTERVSLLSKG